MTEANEAYLHDLRSEFDRANQVELSRAAQTIAPPPTARLTYDGPKAPLFKALAEARKHFGKLTTDAKADVTSREGKFLYSFKYAPLNVVLEALEPGLQAAGLAFVW